MEDKDYEFLVYRLEGASRDNPGAFRLKVLLISGLAYIVLFLFLAGLGGLAYFLFQEARSGHRTGSLIRIGLFCLTLVPVFWVTLRAFLTRLEAPAGRELQREEAPRLFATLDRIRAKLQAPPLHKVLVNDQYNAAICQIPRFGLFGGHRNYLIIGLPYLLGSSPHETIATLAHEYGHLAGDHGKMGAWVYRQRHTFGAIHAKVAADAENNWINGLMAAALDRFAPYFNAYTFVLSRQQEYDADAAASRIAGTEPNASGLIRDELLGRWIAEDFWPRLYAQAGTSPQPRFMPYVALRTACAAAHADWATAERLKLALKQESGLEDTHPCLRERLEAIEGKTALPAIPERSAAEALLGSFARTLVDEFDRQWWEENRAGWQSHYHRQTVAIQRLAELQQRPLADLNPFELQELASLQAERDEPGALATVDHLLRQPGGPYPKAALLKGKLLLGQGDRSGLDHLVAAQATDASLEEECLRTGYWFLRDAESIEAAQAWVNQTMAQA